MKAEELRLDELVRFGEGLVDLHGRRLILHDTHAVGQFRRDLIEMVGWDDARRILTRSGYFWGQDDAAAMKRLFHWDSVEEWLKAGPRLREIWGMGIIEATSFRIGRAVRQPTRWNSPARIRSRWTNTSRSLGLQTNPVAGS